MAARKRGELLGLLRPCFARVEPWMEARGASGTGRQRLTGSVGGVPMFRSWL